MPPDYPRQRCTATTRAGDPCRNYAVHGSDPLRCAAHGGNRNRCTALTRAGKPCPNGAVPGTDPLRCAFHGGSPRRCTALNAAGKPCLHPAVHDSQDEAKPSSNPPRCWFHGGTGALRCTARTSDGRPCPNPAVAGTDPPRCGPHGGGKAPSGPRLGSGQIHGVYSKAGLEDPIADLQHRLRRLSEVLDEIDPHAERETYARWVVLYGDVSARLSRLLLDRRTLAKDEDDPLQQAMNEALDIAAQVLGIDI